MDTITSIRTRKSVFKQITQTVHNLLHVPISILDCKSIGHYIYLATLNIYASLLFLSTIFLSSALKKRVKFNKTKLNFISSNLVHMVRPLWHINKLTIFQVSLIIISHVCMCPVLSVRLKCRRCSQHSL